MKVMDDENDTTQLKGRENNDWTQRRSWTKRVAGPVQFERFTALNAGGVPRIHFVFRIPEGKEKLDDDVYQIINEHKTWPDGHPTGLRFSRDRIHGKTFNLPDDVDGRNVADRLDRKLMALARRLKSEGNRAL